MSSNQINLQSQILNLRLIFNLRKKTTLYLTSLDGKLTGTIMSDLNGLESKDFFWLGFMAYQPFIGYLMPNPVFTYILNIYNLVWLGFKAYRPL